MAAIVRPAEAKSCRPHLVHERLQEEPADGDEDVDDDGSQGKPMGVQRTRVLVEERADAWDAGRVEREVAVRVDLPPRSVGECAVHVVRTEINRAFVGVEEVTVVPIDALEPEAQGYGGDEEGQQCEHPSPAQPARRLGSCGRGDGGLHGVGHCIKRA